MNQKWLILIAFIGIAVCPADAKEFRLKDHGDVKKQIKVRSATAAGENEVPDEIKATQEPSKSEILTAVKEYVQKETAAHEQMFEIMDPVTSKKRRLQLIEFNHQIGKMPGGHFYANADFKDADTGEEVIVDFDTSGRPGHVKVVSAQVYSVEGKARYIYNAQGKRMYFEVSK